MNDQEFLLPWYINESLTADEQRRVENWLQSDPEGAVLQQTTQQIAIAITTQDQKAPILAGEAKLLASIRQPERNRAGVIKWAWSLPLAVLLFICLWVLVQPGTQLQWSVTGDDLAAFRVYRAPVGSTTFELLDEVPATSEQTSYKFTDGTAFIPGRNYHYVIEIVAQNGSTAISPAVVSNTLLNLSSQIAILLTSFMLTFGMITIVREIKFPIQSPVTIY